MSKPEQTGQLVTASGAVIWSWDFICVPKMMPSEGRCGGTL